MRSQPDHKAQLMGNDLRKYARQTYIRLAIGGLILLVIVGGGLIYWLYGSRAAVFGLFCLLGGLIPIVLLGFVFTLLDRYLKSRNG